jgi:hypothetical protein
VSLIGWLPREPAYVQFRCDVPGQPDLKQHDLALGICRTRTIAERRAAEKLERLGINSAQQLSKQLLRLPSNSKEKSGSNPLPTENGIREQTTIDNRRYALDRWIYPSFEGRLLADINNRTMKELVETMAWKLSPASVRDCVNIVKGVVASAINEDGEELFPRTWNEVYIDAPFVKHQRQPSTNGEGVTAILNAASGLYRVLYTLLCRMRTSPRRRGART